jgi:hypothetical protein
LYGITKKNPNLSKYVLERKKGRLTTKALSKVKKQANLCGNGLRTTTGKKFKSELAHPIGLSQLDPPSISNYYDTLREKWGSF